MGNYILYVGTKKVTDDLGETLQKPLFVRDFQLRKSCITAFTVAAYRTLF